MLDKIKAKIKKIQDVKLERKVARLAQMAAREEKKQTIKQENREDFDVPTNATQELEEMVKAEEARIRAMEQREFSVNEAGFKSLAFQPSYQSNMAEYLQHRDRGRAFYALMRENYSSVCITAIQPRLFEYCYDNNVFYSNVIDVPTSMAFSSLVIDVRKKEGAPEAEEEELDRKKKQANQALEIITRAVTRAEIVGGCYITYNDGEFQIENHKQDGAILVSACNKPANPYWRSQLGDFGLSFYEKNLKLLKQIDECWDRLYEGIKVMNLKALKNTATHDVTGMALTTQATLEKSEARLAQIANNLDSKNLLTLSPNEDLLFPTQLTDLTVYTRILAQAMQNATGVPANVFTGEAGASITIGDVNDLQNPLLLQTINKFRQNYRTMIEEVLSKLKDNSDEYVYTWYYNDKTMKDSKYLGDNLKSIADLLSTISNIQPGTTTAELIHIIEDKVGVLLTKVVEK